MKKSAITLVLACLGLLCKINFAQQIQHIADTEKLGYLRHKKAKAAVIPNNYNLVYAQLHLQVNPAINFIKGAVNLHTYHVDTLQQISFELTSDLQVDSITINGTNAAFLHSNNVINAIPATPLPGQQTDVVGIYYQGIPPGSGFGSFVSDVHGPDSIPVMWTLSEPYGARDWWPCKQDLNDKIDSIDIYITAPSAYTVASNGLKQSETILGTNKITHWKHQYPIAAYLVAFAISNYQNINNTITLSNGNLLLSDFVYPESFVDLQNAMSDFTAHFQFFDSLYVPYPFMNEKYGHAQFNWGGGMEHQTMTFVGGFSYELLAHELAHQWWGNHITCGSWGELWLNEGFATYSTGLCYERFSPNLYWKIWKRNQIDFITSSPNGSVYVADTLDINRLFDARLTYSKGAIVLHMLRKKIGDDNFFNALRNYQNNPLLSYNYARNTNLQLELEALSGINLDDFLNQWFYGEGYPSYQLSYMQDSAMVLSFNLNQTTSHPSVGFFALPVPIKFKNATRDTTIIFDHNFSGELFSIQLDFMVDSVIINPNDDIVCNQNTATNVMKLDLQNWVSVFPNPVSQTLFIEISAMGQNQITGIIVYDITGKALETNAMIKQQYTQIDTETLNHGVYLLQIKTKNGNIFKKFIKK